MERIKIIKDDITTLEVDAIVNAANKSLLGGGGVDGAIHRAAGSELLEECRTLNGCETGQAKITGGYNLPAKYVIHTVGPVWHNSPTDPELLESSYLNSLNLAKKKGITSISFPALSTGAFGYPEKEAGEIALKTIIEFMEQNSQPKLVRLVLFGESSFKLHKDILVSLLE